MNCFLVEKKMTERTKTSLCLLLFLTIYILNGLLFSYESYAQDMFSHRFEEAKSYFEKGDLLQAYINFSIAYEYATNNQQRAEIKKYLGDILFRWGDTFAAEEVYLSALNMSPDSFDLLKRVVIAKAENLSDDFYKFFQKIPKDKIDSELLYYQGKYVLLKEKNPRGACDILDSVRRESEYFFKASYLCGVAMIMVGDRSEALRRFEKATLAPDEELANNANLSVARIYTDMGRFQDALPYYLKIPNSSPIFYESKYEVCWVFYGLENYQETQRCIDYFKNAPKTHLTKRIEVLQSFLNMREDLVSAFLTFTAISDYSQALLSRIVDAEKTPKSFWDKDWIKYFASREPNMKSFIQFFPEYKMFEKRRKYIASVRDEIKSILADIQRISSTSTLVADRSVKKYLERVWLIQERILNMLSDSVMKGASYDEKNLWFTLYSLTEELKGIDLKARELVALSSVKISEISRSPEFKNWEKKYEVYRKVMGETLDELKDILEFHRKSSKYLLAMVDKLARNGNESNINELIRTFQDAQNTFFEFANLWQNIIDTINKYLYLQETKLKAANFMLENFLSYLADYELSLRRYLVSSKLKREIFKTYALAQYGFIESAWMMKERESDVLDKLHILRLREENNLRDNYSKFVDEIEKIRVEKKGLSAQTFFETDLSETKLTLDDVSNKIDEMEKSFNKGIGILWVPPQADINKIFEERKIKEEETQKIKKEIEKRRQEVGE